VIVAPAQDRHGSLIARGFEGQNRVHKPIVGQALRLPKSATDAVAPQCLRERAAYFFTASAFGALCCA
jgi:hypothetical protein